MRASPAFQILIDRFGLWRAAVVVVSCAGALSMLGWVLSLPPSASVVIQWVALCVGASVCVLGLSLAGVRPMSLRWDGQRWHLGEPRTAGYEPHSGSLRVVVDLGVWMLLRFEPTTPRSRLGRTWIPAQRRGFEAEWHALRCAVHSPRPPPAESAAADF